ASTPRHRPRLRLLGIPRLRPRLPQPRRRRTPPRLPPASQPHRPLLLHLRRRLGAARRRLDRRPLRPPLLHSPHLARQKSLLRVRLHRPAYLHADGYLPRRLLHSRRGRPESPVVDAHPRPVHLSPPDPPHQAPPPRPLAPNHLPKTRRLLRNPAALDRWKRRRLRPLHRPRAHPDHRATSL